MAQVAARYGVTPQAVYKWIESGRVSAERTPGGSWRLAADQFERHRARQDAATALKASWSNAQGVLPVPLTRSWRLRSSRDVAAECS